MIVKQAFVTRVSWMNPCKTFSIIEKTLASRPNTQIFVSKEIVKDLPLTNALGGSVYAYNEDFMHWCGYYKEESQDTSIFGFAPITKEYMHLAIYYSREHRIEYCHYGACLKKLLLIDFEP